MKISKKDVEFSDFWENRAAQINTPKKMKAFIAAANKAYDITKDPDVLFAALKIIALTKNNISALAKNANVERKSIYNLFKRGSNPTFKNLSAIADNLGVGIHLALTRPRV
jgi:probable addiction module antidote protein